MLNTPGLVWLGLFIKTGSLISHPGNMICCSISGTAVAAAYAATATTDAIPARKSVAMPKAIPIPPITAVRSQLDGKTNTRAAQRPPPVTPANKVPRSQLLARDGRLMPDSARICPLGRARTPRVQGCPLAGVEAFVLRLHVHATRGLPANLRTRRRHSSIVQRRQPLARC